MAEAIEKEQVPQYCAMINIDSFGLATPFVLVNISSAKLVELAADLAKQMQIPFAKVRIEGPNSDSSSFNARKIPAVTLSGLSNEWMSVIHTGNDQVKKVKPVSVYLGYRLALAMWSRIEEAPCEAFR
jgi:Iap family predicted aminopeptidase